MLLDRYVNLVEMQQVHSSLNLLALAFCNSDDGDSILIALASQELYCYDSITELGCLRGAKSEGPPPLTTLAMKTRHPENCARP